MNDDHHHVSAVLVENVERAPLKLQFSSQRWIHVLSLCGDVHIKYHGDSGFLVSGDGMGKTMDILSDPPKWRNRNY